jgi:ATP-dependent Clp protease adaptor protein ClpS
MSSVGFDLDTVTKTETNQRVDKMPMWHVVIHNTDVHTFKYVIEMLCKIFNKTKEEAMDIATKVHHEGSAIVITTTKERAELKCQQVSAYGPDPLLKKSKTSIPCEMVKAD